jgi:single-strand DNA-binding protein
MPSRCLNRVTLIGNLTRDPELRYTPAGMAVVSFGLATNRVWTTKQGERKEDAQFHRIVAWNKLAELCSQLLSKGRRVYVDGRIQYREFMDQENNKKQIAEIVIDDMIIIDNKHNTQNQNNVVGDLSGGQTQNQTQTQTQEEVVVAGAQNSPIEDIVIPDDLGEITVTEDKKEEVSVKEEKVSTTKGKKKKDDTLVVEEKKGEEMPF